MESNNLYDSVHEFLSGIYPERFPSFIQRDNSLLPFVTLTFAQSLDAKIGLTTQTHNERLILSGSESMMMTHLIRRWHASSRTRNKPNGAILVGVSTLISDDPQLTFRSPPLPTLEDGDPKPQVLYQPLPIVLDPHLRSPTSCRLLKNARNARDGSDGPVARAPIFVTLKNGGVNQSGDTTDSERQSKEDWDRRKQILLENGAGGVWECEEERPGMGWISIPSLLHLLASPPPPTADVQPMAPITHLMVEGGAKIIASFLSARIPLTLEKHGDPVSQSKGTTRPAVDRLIITLAPLLVGSRGGRAVNGYPFGDSESTVVPRMECLGQIKLGEDWAMGFELQ